MASIYEYIADIRGIISQHEDDSKFTDPQLYSLLAKAGAMVNRIKVEKSGYYSGWNHTTYAMELEVGTLEDTNDCIPVGCDVLKTKYEVPNPIKSNYAHVGEMMRVLKLDHTRVAKQVGNPNARKYNLYMNERLSWTVVNKKIVIFGGYVNTEITGVFTPKKILVQGLWEDITDWADVPKCGEDSSSGTTSFCFSFEDDLPISDDYAFMVYDYVLRKLELPLQVPREEASPIRENPNH